VGLSHYVATKPMPRTIIVLLLAAFSALNVWSQDTLNKLASDYWTWRAQYQPFNLDDIPRIERPPGLKQSWSAPSVARQKAELAEFESRWHKLSHSAPMAAEVDYRLMGSALARVHWELDYNRRWQRDPSFYLEQTLTPVLEALLEPPPLNDVRSHEVIVRLQNIPSILEDAKANLQHPAAPFAQLAIASLAEIGPQLQIVARDAGPLLKPEDRKVLDVAIGSASKALESYSNWLQQRLLTMTRDAAVGRAAYTYFLKNVALYPYSPEELLQMSRQEWERSVAFEELEQQRNRNVPELTLFASFAEQEKRTRKDESDIRRFLVDQGILTVPSDFPHYVIRPIPSYIEALGNFGEADDFTGPSRLNQDCVRWAPAPSEKLGYFAKANAHDPRPDLMHEGVPGHYMQLWLSWRNPDPIRRYYYDSGVNEGLGFYVEEMMLQAGLFDSSPHSREIIYNFMRLRALRVEVDVKLALGQFTIQQAADYLSRMVPMDQQTARAEAASFATTPGQAISYQTGKIQLIKFLADARLSAGDKFDIKEFNDFVWRNGNVPVELQRLEWFAREKQGSTAAKN
jgi:uncharacterized protein DUF885